MAGVLVAWRGFPNHTVAAFWRAGRHGESWQQPGLYQLSDSWPGYSGSKTPFVRNYALTPGTFASDYHVFAIEWSANQIRFFVDNTVHYTIDRADIERSGQWVFDHPFNVMLNLAVGGNFDRDPVSDTILPATMLVDYVRVYVHD